MKSIQPSLTHDTAPPRDAKAFLAELMLEAENAATKPSRWFCLLGFHRWSRWEHGSGVNLQARECAGCGLRQMKPIFEACPHDWGDIRVGRITQDDGVIIGTYHDQRCTICSELRSVRLIPE
jgi:hypothetical protein